MSDLTDFLYARIAEDQANATGQAQLISDRYGNDPDDKYESAYRYQVDRPSMTVDHRYVMADCAAKRAVIELVTTAVEHLAMTATGCTETTDPGDTDAGSKILHRLAAPYSDHPDFKDAWTW